VGEILVRALVGGVIVSLFALAGDVLKPKSFAGLFGAAPSVALASLALTYRAHDPTYIVTEARWMAVGALAFAAYAWTVCRLLRNGRRSVRGVATATLFVWFVIALGVWEIAVGVYHV
jgi:hypothetical protein